MNKTNAIVDTLAESIQLKHKILQQPQLLATIQAVIELGIQAYRNDKKLLFCGNGGSASDAQHLAAELSGRFYLDREPLFAEALHVNSSFLTATANDYDFSETYARMLRAIGRRGDVLFAISTSGQSVNVIKAAQAAQTRGLSVVALTGENGGQLGEYCDYLINIPSRDTPRIQEIHILVGHIICEQIEQAIFG